MNNLECNCKTMYILGQSPLLLEIKLTIKLYIVYNKELCDSTNGVVWDSNYLAWYYTSNSILIRSDEKKVKGNQRKQFAVIFTVVTNRNWKT